MVHHYGGNNNTQAHWGVSRSTAKREILVQVANDQGDWARLPMNPVDALAFAEALAVEAKQALRQAE